jgi:hypothetical protein
MVIQLQNVRIADYNYARFYHDDAYVSMIIALFRLPALLISSRVDLSPRCANLNSLLVLIGRCLDVRFHSRVCLTGYQMMVSGVYVSRNRCYISVTSGSVDKCQIS